MTRVRTAEAGDARGIAEVQVAAWQEAFAGLRVTLVACGESELVTGFASAMLINDGRFRSYLHTLYVLPDHWGRGIGRALVLALSARLLDLGIHNMVLRTLRLGAARRFYERLGARIVPEGFPHDDGQFDDVVYAFDDLRALVESTG